ncbi:hypothetical protein JCM10212_003275 [Sporobolomyces blumeae]
MTETSAYGPTPTSTSVPSPASPSAYYGLATQLRTPPTDFTPSFAMSKSLSGSEPTRAASPEKKMTPAMRDEFGFAPQFVPAWSSKDQGTAPSRNGDEEVWTGSRRAGGGGGTSDEGSSVRTSPRQNRSSNYRSSTAPRPTHTPHVSQSSKHQRKDSLRDVPVFGKIDFNFKPMQQPLDLVVTLDPIHSTTYQTTTVGPSAIEEEDETASRNDTTASTAPPAPPAAAAAVPAKPVPAKSPSLGSPLVARSAPVSPTMRPPPPTIPDSFAAAFPASRTITPASKHEMNLITLARRTTHLSDVPGYDWRLNLLEKLEVLTGSFIAIKDAEAILSIGQPTKASRAAKLESRRSQIFIPPTASSKLAKRRGTKLKEEEPTTFFGKMRRVLSHPGQAPPAKESAPPLPAPKRTVFGKPLAQIAEYAFVTSMIAGQRHDLPGVCFSTVEEIYRRGQGSKVPGLLQLAGEPGRVARLVQIFDSAPDYGEHLDLSVESIHNVCSLLKKYLHDLPEPILDDRVYRLFLAGCVDSTNSLPRRVAAAQVILRLLPTTHFSLLVYLVAFLSQAPLFPSNPLSLETVSEIFAASIMAPRSDSSSSSLSKKPNKGQMIITGPTDLSDDASGKKANEALTWLLKNWSAIADGLLELDFDVDVDALVPPTSPAPPSHTTSPRVEALKAQSPPVSPRTNRNLGGFESSTPRPAPTPPVRGLDTFPGLPAPAVRQAVPGVALAPSVPSTKTASSSEVPRYLATLANDEDDDDARSAADDDDDDEAPSSSQTKSRRPQSNSSYATSIQTPPVEQNLDHRASTKSAAPVQLSPEDERGPLEPVAPDDVVEFDDYSSVYSFPAPPTSVPAPAAYHHRLPSLPPSPFLTQEEIALALAEQDKAVASATLPQASTFAPLEYYDDEADEGDRTEDLDASNLVSVLPPASMVALPESPALVRSPILNNLAEFEPKRRSISKEIMAPHLVRTKSAQLDESRQIIAQQRLEIQSLWEKLTTLEAERVKEREQMADLAKDIHPSKSESRATDASSEQADLRSELDKVRGELQRSEAERLEEQRKSQEQVANLEKQLADIRKVLLPLLGSGIQV